MENLKGKIFSGFFWKFGERFLVQLVTFVISLVLARIISPESYGLVAIITIFINIANVFVTTGFSSALIQNQNSDDEDFSTIFYCSFFISIIIYGILYFIAPLLSSFYKLNELTKLIRVFSLILPISSYNSIQIAYISKKMEFKKNFISSFLGSVISGIFGIILAYNNYGVWALIWQMLINNIVSCIVLMFLIDWRPRLKFSIKKAKPMLKYGVNILGADLLGTIFNQLNSFIIGKKYSPADLAYYNRGQSFPYLINNNICTIIANVMFPAFSTESTDFLKIKDMAKKTTLMTTYILCPVYFGMIAVSNNLIITLLTDKWIKAVPFMNIVCIACILGTISPTDLQILKAIGKSDIVLKMEFIKKPIWLCLMIVALFINIYALAFVIPIITLVELIINSIYIKKYINYSIMEKLKDWCIGIIPSLLMFITIMLFNFIPLNNTVLLILQILCGFFVYIVYSVLLKNNCYKHLINIIKNKKKGDK